MTELSGVGQPVLADNDIGFNISPFPQRLAGGVARAPVHIQEVRFSVHVKNVTEQRYFYCISSDRLANLNAAAVVARVICLVIGKGSA